MLPWSAVRFVLGLGDRSFSARGKARLRALRSEIELVSDESGLPPAFLAALVFVESEGDPEAIGEPIGSSGQQARGLLQVLPSNWQKWGVPEYKWTDPLVNLRAGVRVLLEPPAPLGKVEIGESLAAFGGFITVDPSQYIEDVKTLTLRARRELGYSLLPRPPFAVPDLEA